MDMLHFQDAVIDGMIEQNEQNDGEVLPVERRMPNCACINTILKRMKDKLAITEKNAGSVTKIFRKKKDPLLP